MKEGTCRTVQHSTPRRRPRLERSQNIVAGLAPMHNLDQFLIDDLMPDEQDEFYKVLEQA